MNNEITLAVLITCFNRKEKTIRCVKSLINQKNIPIFDLYVCDDGSTDGTADAIKEIYKDAIIIKGTGNLFWSKGMYTVMSEAVKHNYEYYLMINDDVEFVSNMWNIMFEPYENGHKKIAVVGYTKSHISGKVTYGGRKMIKSRFNYVIGDIVEIEKDNFATVDVANWNCFLVDKETINTIGIIDNYYEHGLGDYDYCLRMRKEGLNILVAKDYIGYCENNSRKNTYLDGHVSRKQRIKKMLKPNGFPIKSWLHFVNKNYGKYKFRSAITPYLKNISAIILGREIK